MTDPWGQAMLSVASRAARSKLDVTAASARNRKEVAAHAAALRLYGAAPRGHVRARRSPLCGRTADDGSSQQVGTRVPHLNDSVSAS